jgi:outer membrane protein assembly factor BamB
VAFLSGAFLLIVCATLIVNYVQVRATDPLDNPALLNLREQFAESPGPDKDIIEQIRALDLLSRKAFFTSQEQLRTGGILLLCGAIVFLVSFRLAARWNPVPPSLQDKPGRPDYWRTMAQSKELITGVSVILALVALTAGYLTRYELPVLSEPATLPDAQDTAQTAPAPTDATPQEAPATSTKGDAPDWEAMQQQWPSFRGPGGFGVAYYTTAPMQWDGESGENIRWKVEAPAPGFNSPVVWDNRVFLSNATKEMREVFCYDTESGEQLWKQALPAFPGTPADPPKVSDDTGYAASTMAVHGDRAFAIFATGDLACYDIEGNLLWGKNVGVPDNHYGHSSSLIAYQDLLFVQLDDKANPRLLALDIATGEERWVAQREKISWASPSCIPTSFGMQIVLASELKADAYDPATGTLLWSEECLDGEVAPSPAFGADTVFVANEYAIATAIRITETDGEVQSEIAWEWEDALPEVSSPVASDEHCYIATSFGEIVCLDIKTGEETWLQEFMEGFYASLIRVGDRIYAIDLEGVTRIFRTGETFELIGEPELGEPTYATPAYLDKRIYVRTESHLLCIEDHD